MFDYPSLYIDGRWTTPTAATPFEVRSPHDQSVLGRAAQATPQDIDLAVATARRAFDFGPWPRLSPEVRQAYIERLRDLHAERRDELAAMVTSENGTPLWFTEWVFAALPEQTNAYLRAAKSLGWEEVLDVPGATSIRIHREPVGVVAAIIPWNSPHQSALAKLVPALLAGCTVILKPSPETAADALVLAEIFDKCDFPEGVLSVVPADRATSEYLASHPGIDKVAFTGSTDAGRKIASIAGQQLKRVSLELGGKSACIVTNDVDLDKVVESLKFFSLANNGENCVAHTRILVHKSIYSSAVDAITEMVRNLKVGNPLDRRNFIGPMVRSGQQKRVQSYIRLGLQEGARLTFGGVETPHGLEGGYYVSPSIFADARNSMRIAQEEIFGPVLVIIPFNDDDEAVALANDSLYGLGGGVWSIDSDRALRIARRMRTGAVSINGAPQGFDGPFGGYKASGIGREFGMAGLSQYIEYKTVSMM